jgi:hypothetical protein
MSSVSHADCPSSPADFAAAAKGKGYVVHADLKAMFFKLGMEMTDYDVETMMDALGVESGRINYEQWCRLVDDQADDQASPPSTIEAGAFEAGTGETGSVVYEGAVEKKGYLRKNWKHRCFVLQIPIGSGGDGRRYSLHGNLLTIISFSEQDSTIQFRYDDSSIYAAGSFNFPARPQSQSDGSISCGYVYFLSAVTSCNAGPAAGARFNWHAVSTLTVVAASDISIFFRFDDEQAFVQSGYHARSLCAPQREQVRLV